MKIILAFVILVAMFAVPAVVGFVPNIPIGTVENSTFQMTAINSVLGMEAGGLLTGAGTPLTLPELKGPGNSEAQQFRKYLNDLPIMKNNDLRMNGVSPLAHLLQPEFDPFAPLDTADIASFLHDIQGPPGQQKSGSSEAGIPAEGSV